MAQYYEVNVGKNHECTKEKKSVQCREFMTGFERAHEDNYQLRASYITKTYRANYLFDSDNGISGRIGN